MEQQIINLKKNEKVVLSKKNLGDNYNYIYTGLRWGKVIIPGNKTYSSKREVVYTGNWFQKFLHIGPCEMRDEKVLLNCEEDKTLDIDLDSSILIYNKNKELLETIYYHNKLSRDGAIKHYGDDLNGSTLDNLDKDNEIIRIDVNNLSKDIAYIVVILNIYQHTDRSKECLVFDKIPFAEMKIYSSNSSIASEADIKQLKTFANFKMDNNPDFEGKKALVLGAFVKKRGACWEFVTSGEMTNEMSIFQMISGSVKKFISSL